MRIALSFSLIGFLSVLFSCSSVSSERTADATLAIIAASTQNDSAHADLTAPREEAFARSSAADASFVSEGWRATKERRFADLGARLPERASETMEVGVSRFERLTLRVTLAAAAPVTGRLNKGRVVYGGVFTETDRVVVANATELEELLVLHGTTAPRSFAWNIQIPLGIAAVAEQEGGLRFQDARGRDVITMPAPRAWDRAGHAVPLLAAWSESERSLRVALAEEPATWPVVIDPAYQTSAWFDAASRDPAARTPRAITYDSVRNQVVMFGGALTGSARTNETWTWDGSRWSQRVLTTKPPARDVHGIAFDAARGEVVVFGGFGPTGHMNDTWTWNGVAWSQRTPPVSPPERSAHALAYDAIRNQVVLFGGYNNAGILNDTWSWDGTTWTQRAMMGPVPSPRTSVALGFDAARSEVVLFGGEGSGGTLDDTWTWNGTQWSQRSVATKPSARQGSALAFDSVRNEVVLFGGGYLNDTWAWNGTSWTRRLASGPPDIRSGHGMAFDATRGRVLLFGGSMANGVGYLNDTWTWDGTTWTYRAPAVPPSPRAYMPMVFDAVRGQTVLFGGSANPPLGDTWTWDGVQWTRRFPSSSPPGRSGHAMAFDAARGEVVVVGGATNSPAPDGTWIWNGTTWTLRATGQTPAVGRSYHAVAFDAARAQVVLFGGFGASLFENDTYVWDGAAWTRRFPAQSPPARNGHTLAYDAVRREVVLFGGGGGSGLLSDTWVWDGSTWTERAPLSSPPARSSHAAVFDSVQGQVLLFGGGVAGTTLSDTWSWDGVTWTQRSPIARPTARYHHAMAFDAARNETVVFGGLDTTTFFNDTWIHKTLGGACNVDADCLDQFCNDGVCCDAKACGTCATCAGTTPGRCSPVTNREDSDSCAQASGKSCSDLGDCKIALGVPATRPADCASGFIVDGVCCATSSCPTCQTCDVAKQEGALHPGFCDFARAGSDPKNDCTDEGAATCRTDGACDGAGKCRIYPRGTPCGNNVCNRNAATGQFCTGAGECLDDPNGIDCGSYVCKGGACLVSCTVNEDCAALHHCENAICVADRGAACDGDHTVVTPAGQRLDCKLYRCEGATCKTACTSKTDCVGDADCSPEGQCVAFARVVPEEKGGCAGCAMGRPAGFQGSVVVGVWLAAFTRRVKKRARRSHAR